MSEKKTPSMTEFAARLEAMEARIQELQAENAALRAGAREPIAPATEREMLFTGLAVRVIDGPRGSQVREIVGMPGQELSLRTDIAAAWERRGKCVPADSEAAAAWRKDKKAQEDAAAAAEAAEAAARQTANQRAAKEGEVAQRAAKKSAA